MVVKALLKSGLLCYLMLVSQYSRADSEVLSVHLKGVVMPAQQVNFSFAQSGLLRQLVKEGDEIVKGKVLAQLDNNKARAELGKNQALVRAAQSKLAAAEHQRNKSARLVNENILSDIALVEADFSVATAIEDLAVAKSQLAIAQASLTDCQIFAPFDGAVINIKARVGEWVNAGDPFLTFVNYQTLNLSIDIPPAMADGLYLGLSTDVVLDNEIVGLAVVKSIYPVVDPASGLLRIVWRITANLGVGLSGRYVSLMAWSSNEQVMVKDGL